MTKVQLYVILVLRNVRMVPSYIRKKIRKLPNVIKVQSHMILVLHNAKIMPSNVMFW